MISKTVIRMFTLIVVDQDLIWTRMDIRDPIPHRPGLIFMQAPPGPPRFTQAASLSNLNHFNMLSAPRLPSVQALR